MNKKLMKQLLMAFGALACLGVSIAAEAASGAAGGGGGVTSQGIGGVASQVTGNLTNVAKLITAGAYVVGMAFAVGAIVKFKAHKDNPTQIPIGTPIALLFVAAALIFLPSVFKTSGSTLFGASGTVAGASGLSSFGATKAGS